MHLRIVVASPLLLCVSFSAAAAAAAAVKHHLQPRNLLIARTSDSERGRTARQPVPLFATDAGCPLLGLVLRYLLGIHLIQYDIFDFLFSLPNTLILLSRHLILI